MCCAPARCWSTWASTATGCSRYGGASSPSTRYGRGPTELRGAAARVGGAQRVARRAGPRRGRRVPRPHPPGERRVIDYGLPPPDWVVEAAGAQPYPLVFATVSGAHLYGFASVDSDVDLRGVHVLPLDEVIGLRTGPETLTAHGARRRRRAGPGHPRPGEVRPAAAAAQRLRARAAALAAGRDHVRDAPGDGRARARAASPTTTPTTTSASRPPSGGSSSGRGRSSRCSTPCGCC